MLLLYSFVNKTRAPGHDDKEVAGEVIRVGGAGARNRLLSPIKSITKATAVGNQTQTDYTTRRAEKKIEGHRAIDKEISKERKRVLLLLLGSWLLSLHLVVVIRTKSFISHNSKKTS